MRVSEVADQLSVDLSVASRQVAALVLAGYVEREPDPDDRRATRLRPTEAGTRVLTDSHRRMVTHRDQRLERVVGRGDRRALASQLERLREDFARRGVDRPPGARRMTAITEPTSRLPGRSRR